MKVQDFETRMKGDDGGLFRPHPGPLPQERENHPPPVLKSDDLDNSYRCLLEAEQVGAMRWTIRAPATSIGTPSPGGEGRGEGGRLNKFLSARLRMAPDLELVLWHHAFVVEPYA